MITQNLFHVRMFNDSWFITISPGPCYRILRLERHIQIVAMAVNPCPGENHRRSYMYLIVCALRNRIVLKRLASTASQLAVDRDQQCLLLAFATSLDGILELILVFLQFSPDPKFCN